MVSRGPMLSSGAMFRSRRLLAGLLVFVFTAVEVFAAAPQLHFHSQGGTTAGVGQPGPGLSTRSDGNTTPNDCAACRTFSLATALISWVGITPPTEHQTIALTPPTLAPASGFLEDARGRAPPAC
jgi:hypothetical protein